MKKLSSILSLFICLLLVTTSCNKAKSELQNIVNEGAKNCPYDLGIVGQLSNIVYDQEADEVLMTLSIKEGIPIKLNVMREMINTLQKTLMSSFAESSSSTKLMKKIAAADGKVTIVMKDASGDKLEIPLSESDVKDIANGNVASMTAKEYIDFQIALTNAQCPAQVDEITVMQSVRLEGNYWIYKYTVNEEYITMEDLEANIDMLKQNTLQTLSVDTSGKILFKNCKEAGIKLRYEYVGDQSGYSCHFDINPYEL